jgi:hypothetical protein
LILTDKAIQPLRRHLVRLRPTGADLARRHPIVLTPRDKEILAAVHMHGFLTTQLVELAFFPPPPRGRVSACTRAYARLDGLWRWEYLERLERPVSRHLGGRLPYLYALGRRGVPVVSTMLPADARPVQLRRLDRKVELFVDHQLTVATLWANLRAVLGRSGLRWTWVPEPELRRRRLHVRPPDSRWKLPVLPDGCFRVDYPDGAVQCCLVEVDLGTLTLARFRKKLRAFELARSTNLFRWLWDEDDFEVAVLTHSAGRLRSLQQAAREEVPPEWWGHYLFATVDALPAADVAGAHWFSLEPEAEPERLLYDDAYGEHPA